MLIALSGGADSVALLLYLKEQGQAEAAAHCNFHLRGEESDHDEQFVRQLCLKVGIKLHVRHFNTTSEAQQTGESIEMAARRLRYEWFAQLCQEEGYAAVAVAHHQEDNAETILLNLVRGTGLRGLCGIRQERDGVVRPLLNWTKQDILHFLAERQQDYVTDSTNADTAYKRNFIRHEVIPMLQSLNPQVVKTLNQMGQRLSAAELIYRQGIHALTEKYRQRTASGWQVPCALLEKEKELAPTLLHEWLSPLGFTAAQTAEVQHLRTGALLESPTHLLTRTPTHIEWSLRATDLSPIPLDKESGEVSLGNGSLLRYKYIDASSLSAIPRERSSVALDAELIHGPLIVRRLQTGDRFHPFGMKGTKLVSDYLTDRHRSRIEKMNACVLTDAGGILWLINERPDQRAAVTSGTRHLLLLSTSPDCHTSAPSEAGVASSPTHNPTPTSI